MCWLASCLVVLACAVGRTGNTNATGLFPTPKPGIPTVGMEGRLEVALPGTLLEGRPVDERSPIIVRVAESFPHGALIRYDLRYIGLEPGKYDLRDHLRRQDGSALGDLPSLPVEIAGLLPKAHTGELIERAPGVLGLFGGYRNVVILVGVAWVVGLLALWLSGRRRREAAATSSLDEPPSLADRLRPLVEQAAAGTLGADGKAQLERLLLTHWRERLELGELDQAEAIGRLRDHPEAGRLLIALESWLHRPPGTAQVEVNALLAPYAKLPEHARPGNLTANEPE